VQDWDDHYIDKETAVVDNDIDCENHKEYLIKKENEMVKRIKKEKENETVLENVNEKENETVLENVNENENETENKNESYDEIYSDSDVCNYPQYTYFNKCVINDIVFLE